MPRILFTAFGSYGDLYPYLALGIELRNRGHQVTIGTSPNYRSKIESENLAFAAIRPNVSLDDREMIAYVFDPRHGSERILRMVTSVIRESYEDTFRAAQAADVIVTHPITFAAVLVARKLRLRWFSTILAPISFLSAYDPPVLAPAPWLANLRTFGPGPMKAIFALGRRKSLQWVQAIAELRNELGIAPYGNPIFEGSHSPSLVLALFSKILAQPQPDWPPQTVVTGFPFYDGAPDDPGLAPELKRFFDAGPPPVVFTLGSSAVGAAGDFYLDSLKAVQRMGIRALFLTGSHAQNLPDTLPQGIMAWPYAAHSEVFPRAAAIVHQGGAGTTGQAMRSGKPMLVVPFGHDQFDNGERVRRLGAAEVVYRPRYNPQRAEAALRRLTGDPSFSRAAALVGEKVAAENGCVVAADALEAQLTGPVP